VARKQIEIIKEVYKWAIGGTNRKIEKKSIMHDFKPKTTILYA
jgi:hypothetical protein